MSPNISAMKYHNYDTAIKCHGITNYSYISATASNDTLNKRHEIKKLI